MKVVKFEKVKSKKYFMRASQTFA